MKKTQFIELIKNIKKTLVSFISIIFFVMLGTALFLGIGWCTKGFMLTLDKTINDLKVHDFEIMYPYGLDEDAISLVKKIDNVEDVEGVYSTEAFFNLNSQNYQAKIISLTNNIDIASKIVGKLPSNKGEIAIERFWAENHGVNIDDTIKFKHDLEKPISINNLLDENIDALKNNDLDEDGMNYLNTDTYKVTGFLETGTYINQYRVTYGVSSLSGIPNDCIMYVDKKSFDTYALPGYTSIVALCPSFHKNTYDSDEYKEDYEYTEELIKNSLISYTNNKFEKINNAIDNVKYEIHKELDDGKKEYEKNKKLLRDGEIEIKNGKEELEKGRAELEDAQKQIDSNKAEINSNGAIINKTENDLTNIGGAYDTAHGFLTTYKYVSDNYSNIVVAITNINDAYLSNQTYIDSNASSNDLFIFNYIIAAFGEIPSSTSNSALASCYTKLLNNLMSNPNFISFDSLITDFQNLHDATSDATIKSDILDIINGLDVFKNSPNEVLSLPNTTYTLYRRLINANVDDIYNSPLVIQLNSALSAQGVSIQTLISEIVDDLANNRQTFNELYGAFANQMSYLDGKDCDTIIGILESNKHYIDEALTEFSVGKSQYLAGVAKLNSAQNKIDNGWYEYNQNKELLQKKEKELADGKKKLDEALIELEKAEKDVKEFDDNIPVIEKYDASILGRSSNAGIASATIPNNIMSNVKYTMALLFVLVGAFVCYSALSRIVYDQTVQLGTKKALGFNEKEITLSFILYALAATTVGSIIGVLLARFVIEKFILITLAKNYIVGELVSYFSLKDSILFYLFELLITISATMLACHKSLKRKTTELLANQSQLLGKRRFFENFYIWKKLPLLIKTIINNCLNDTRRVFATLIGIVGCCSLMVCAITLITNLYASFDYQMEHVTAFDTLVYFDTNNSTVIENISKALQSKDIDYATSVNSTYITKSPTGSYLSSAFFSYDDDKFKNYFHIDLNGVNVTRTDGIYISKAYAQNYHLNEGDNLIFLNSKGEEINTPIAGIFDFYLLRGQLIVPKEYYETIFNEKPKVNTFVFNKGDLSTDELYDLLSSIDGFISVFDYATEADELYSSLTSSVLIIVITFFILSIILALLVLLNLMIMFVNEKKRELIVLMINGFTRGDAKKYIYGDTIFLTIIGILIGIVLGVSVGFATLKTFDSECVTVMKTINIPSYLICGLCTAVLTALTCLISLRKIDKFSLTDINKA